MGIILGRLILKYKNPYLQLFVGILVVRLLSLLPMVGAFVWVVSAMIVQGFIVYESYQSIKYKENRIFFYCKVIKILDIQILGIIKI